MTFLLAIFQSFASILISNNSMGRKNIRYNNQHDGIYSRCIHTGCLLNLLRLPLRLTLSFHDIHDEKACWDWSVVTESHESTSLYIHSYVYGRVEMLWLSASTVCIRRPSLVADL